MNIETKRLSVLSLWFVIFLGILLAIYTFYRASTLSITHDEGVISKIIDNYSSKDIFKYVIPQDHMINTLLMKWSSELFLYGFQILSATCYILFFHSAPQEIK